MTKTRFIWTNDYCRTAYKIIKDASNLKIGFSQAAAVISKLSGQKVSVNAVKGSYYDGNIDTLCRQPHNFSTCQDLPHFETPIIQPKPLSLLVKKSFWSWLINWFK